MKKRWRWKKRSSFREREGREWETGGKGRSITGSGLGWRREEEKPLSESQL